MNTVNQIPNRAILQGIPEALGSEADSSHTTHHTSVPPLKVHPRLHAATAATEKHTTTFNNSLLTQAATQITETNPEIIRSAVELKPRYQKGRCVLITGPDIRFLLKYGQTRFYMAPSPIQESVTRAPRFGIGLPGQESSQAMSLADFKFAYAELAKTPGMNEKKQEQLRQLPQNYADYLKHQGCDPSAVAEAMKAASF